MKSILILDEAIEDLRKGREYHDDRDPGLGDYFASSILDDIDTLATLHGFHSTQYGSFKLLAKRFPFGIYYRIDGDVVMIRAILDLRSRPTKIRRQLKGR